MKLEGHISGCSIHRTGWCICPYLNQWTPQENTMEPPIDNITRDEYGTLTTRLGNLTLTHDKACATHYRARTHSSILEFCDCYISRARTVTFPDGTPTITPEMSPQQWMERVEFHKKSARMWERSCLIASLLGVTGWALSIARGIWGF